jgi:hypothetical protein
MEPLNITSCKRVKFFNYLTFCAGNFFFLKEEGSQLQAVGFKEYRQVEAALNILGETGLEDSLPAHRLTSYRAAAARCGLFHANQFTIGMTDTEKLMYTAPLILQYLNKPAPYCDAGPILARIFNR